MQCVNEVDGCKSSEYSFAFNKASATLLWKYSNEIFRFPAILYKFHAFDFATAIKFVQIDHHFFPFYLHSVHSNKIVK